MTTATRPNPLPEATHTWHPTETVDVAATLPLAADILRSFAARSKKTDAELLAQFRNGVSPNLMAHDYDLAHAAGALVAARDGSLDQWSAADVERAAETLQALNALEPAAA